MSDRGWQPWTCEGCGRNNDQRGRMTCVQCKKPSPAHAQSMRTSGAWVRGLLLVSVLLPLVGAGAYFALEYLDNMQVRSPSPWTVRGHSWKRTVVVETRGTWEGEKWCSTMRQEFPSAHDVRTSQRKRSTTKVESGEECVGRPPDEICRPAYSDVAVMDDWCAFTWEGWKEKRRAVSEAASVSPPPAWPEIELADGEREGARDELYVEEFESGERDQSCRYPLDQWSAMQVGSRWTALQKLGSGKMGCGTLEPMQ